LGTEVGITGEVLGGEVVLDLVEEVRKVRRRGEGGRKGGRVVSYPS